MSKTLVTAALAASLAIIAFAPAASANPLTDMQCGSLGGCCPTAISCLCDGPSTVLGCVEKVVGPTPDPCTILDCLIYP